MAVLPALVDRLETIAIRIENVRRIIARIIIHPRHRWAIVGRACCHGCLIERVHLCLALGDKAHMRRPGVRFSPPQPKENTIVPSEALEIGMSFRAILPVVVNGMDDAQRLESRLIKGNRPIKIRDGDEDVVEHGLVERLFW